MGRNWVPDGVLTACATSRRKLLEPKSTAATKSADVKTESCG